MKNKNIDKTINGHAHLIPDPRQIPGWIKKAGYFNVITRSGKQFMTQNKWGWERPVSDPTFFVDAQLRWMRSYNVVHTLVLTLSQLYCNGILKKPTLDIIKFQNDFQLELQENYPKKFSCGYVLQPRFLKEALAEMERCHKLGLKFVCLPTHYQRIDGKFVSSTDTHCQEIFALANELGIPVQFHPYDYERIITKLADLEDFWSGHKIAMPYLTGHHYDQFISKDLYSKYPNVRFYFSHGNMLGLASTGRQYQALKGRPDLLQGVTKTPLDALKAENIYYDSLVHDPDFILFMKQKTSTDRIMLGFDSPYPLGSGITYLKDGDYPGRILDLAEQRGHIVPAEKRKMKYINSLEWLYGKNATGVSEFILKYF